MRKKDGEKKSRNRDIREMMSEKRVSSGLRKRVEAELKNTLAEEGNETELHVGWRDKETSQRSTLLGEMRPGPTVSDR